MRRRHIALFVVFILLVHTVCTALAFAEDKPFLPDPGVSVKAQGKLQPEEVEQDGQLFRAYDYSFTCGENSSVSTVLMVMNGSSANWASPASTKRWANPGRPAAFPCPP